MVPNENEFEEESSSIPPPDPSGADYEDDSGEVSDEQLALDDMKNRADQLGVKYHPSIGIDKLRAKVQEAMADEPAEEAPKPKPATKESAERVKLKQDALKLVRVRITCMDPMKKEHQGDFFLTGNALVGTIKRYVPFGVEWHVPQITLNMIQEKKFQQFSTSKNQHNVDMTTSRLVKTYAVEILSPLTEKELKELGQRQAMARGDSSD